MKEKDKKEPMLKFAEFPKDLKVFFYKKGLLFIGCLLAIVIFLIVSKMLKYALILFGIDCLYLLFCLSQLLDCKKRKYMVYTGIFEKKNYKEVAYKQPFVKKKQTVVGGPSSIIIVPEGQNYKFIVPVGSGFEAEPGNEITVYSKPGDIYEKDNNSYYFSNALLVKRTKI